MGDNRPGIVYSNGSPRWSRPTLARAILAGAGSMKPPIPIPLEIRASPGQSIEHFCAQLVVWSWFASTAVIGCFNGHFIIARPGSQRGDLLQQWFDSCRRQILATTKYKS